MWYVDEIYFKTLQQATSLAGSRKAVEAHGCKPWVTNLSTVPHTLAKYINRRYYLPYYLNALISLSECASIPYMWKYWRALHLAIWLQTGNSKILAGFKFGEDRQIPPPNLILRQYFHLYGSTYTVYWPSLFAKLLCINKDTKVLDIVKLTGKMRIGEKIKRLNCSNSQAPHYFHACFWKHLYSYQRSFFDVSTTGSTQLRTKMILAVLNLVLLDKLKLFILITYSYNSTEWMPIVQKTTTVDRGDNEVRNKLVSILIRALKVFQYHPFTQSFTPTL